MVALLNEDDSLTSTRYIRCGNVVQPVRSQLTFGLGRRVNAVLLAGVLMFALVLTVRVAQSSAAEPPAEPGSDETAVASESVYVVQPGDTLWAIATELTPGEDPRPTVDRLVELNGSASIVAGQRIVLPS